MSKKYKGLKYIDNKLCGNIENNEVVIINGDVLGNINDNTTVVILGNVYGNFSDRTCDNVYVVSNINDDFRDLQVQVKSRINDIKDNINRKDAKVYEKDGSITIHKNNHSYITDSPYRYEQW